MAYEGNFDKSFFRFEDLRVYHKALDYSQWIFNNSREFNDKDFSAEFTAVSRKISLQIAEGSSRKKSQFSYYLKMAKSSTRECLVYTSLAEKYNLLNAIQIEESRDQLIGLTKMLGALISSLQKPKNNKRNDHDLDEQHEDVKFEEVVSEEFGDFDDLPD